MPVFRMESDDMTGRLLATPERLFLSSDLVKIFHIGYRNRSDDMTGRLLATPERLFLSSDFNTKN